METPYHVEEHMRKVYQDERRPYGAECNNAPRMYAKTNYNEVEIASTLLLQQTSHPVPQMFCDLFSDEFVSMERNVEVVELKDVLEGNFDVEIDIDSLLNASAQRGIVGDRDTHKSQYAVTPQGQVYTFDFGDAGAPINDLVDLTAGGIVGKTSNFIRELDLTYELEISECSGSVVEDVVLRELGERMRDMAEEIDIERFNQQLKQNPVISQSILPEQNEHGVYVYDSFDVNQLVSNIQNLRSENFDLEIHKVV